MNITIEHYQNENPALLTELLRLIQMNNEIIVTVSKGHWTQRGQVLDNFHIRKSNILTINSRKLD